MMQTDTPVLVSHALCPYVQRAAIVLAEKRVAFERRDIDLACKPDWFLRLSPLGKTPVLLVGGEALFESAVICDYLDEAHLPALYPADPLQRARQRAWMAFGSEVLGRIGAFYNAADVPALQDHAAGLRAAFERLEAELGDGPYFAGEAFGVVDAVFAPVFRYFDVIDSVEEVTPLGLWRGLARVSAWRKALSARPSVADAVGPDYPARLTDFLRARRSALSRWMAA